MSDEVARKGAPFDELGEAERDLFAATRSDALPDVPTVSEFLPGYEASGWSGFGSPKSTPPEVIDKLNREINSALADLKIKAQLADLGATPLVGPPPTLAGSSPKKPRSGAR